MKRQYTIYNICVLLALLFLGGGWNDAWGQTYSNGWNSEETRTVQDKQTNLPNSVIGTSTETIYVIDDENFKLHLQDDGARDNFNGYIRWYNSSAADETTNLSADNTTRLRKYKNGFYWAQIMDNPVAPAGLITYTNSSISDNNPETIVCEASSLTDYGSSVYTTGPWNDQKYHNYLTEGATVNVRKHFIIKSATNRESFLSGRKSNFSSKSWYTSLTSSLSEEDIQSIQDRATGFPEVYDVHTPMEAGTSYRLAERLSNYIVKIDSKEYHANQVRWRVFDSDGSPVTDSHCNIVRHNWNGNKKYEFEEIQMTNGSIILGESSYIDEKRESVGYQSEYNKPNIINFYYNLDGVDKTKQQHFYIMAEVRYYQEEKDEDETTITTQSDWYPISFITVYLEPNSEPLDDNNLPEDRKPATLADDNAYKLLASMTFDDTDTSKPTADTNYPSSDNVTLLNTLFGSDSETYYGFAMPDKYRLKKNNTKEGNRFVGRGEYAFYKSLNIEGISPGENQSTDIYYANWPSKSYQVKVTDRLHESKGHPDGSDYGYFLYVDAADEAGLIAKLRFTEKLCQRTSLVGTAWVCNLKATDTDGQSALNADIGFTLKGLTLNEDGTYTESAPLYKFYTGEVKNKPEGGTGFSEYAKWQQVYFKFNIKENYDYDAYIVEVANNCRNSHGADYAVDQIEIRCTLPDISVQRENACESSTLQVSSDYKTLLQNMGWDVDPNVLSNADLSDPDVRKYRYGIMGNDPNGEPYNYVGNVYYGFTDKIGKDGVTGADADDWVTVNKDLSYNKENELLYRLSKTMRVVIPTVDVEEGDLQGGDGTNHKPYTLPDNPIDAQKNEIIMNVRALNDFISDTGEKEIEKPDGTSVRMTIWSSDDLQKLSVDIETLKNYLKLLCDVSTPENGNATGKVEWVKVDDILKDKNLMDVYEKSLFAMYTFLEVPRIRCPWLVGDDIYLGSINVDNTDLKFAGEKVEGQDAPASGKYEVIIFGAQVANNSAVNFNDDCLLHSSFIVRPSITITVDGEARTSGITCYNSIHTLEAVLWVTPVDEYGNETDDPMLEFDQAYSGKNYTFDWFLGTDEELKTVTNRISGTYEGTKTLQSLLKACRDAMGNTVGLLMKEAIEESEFYTEHKEDAELIIELLGDGETEPKLASGKKVTLRWINHIIAIPYVPEFEEGEKTYVFCLDTQGIDLNGSPNVPELSVGFPNIPDDVQIDNVPLRLGLWHLQEGITLNNIPIQEAIDYGVTSNAGGSLGIYKEDNIEDKEILLRLDGSVYVPVATLNSLFAKNDSENNNLSLTFREPGAGYSYTLKSLFKEGEIYSLYIPFGEYDSSSNFIEGSCEGYAVLLIKVVPEYLTWKGTSTDKWYVDSKWNQSSEEELYMSDASDDDHDANGTDDDLTKAYSPLYFTKVTVDGGNPLSLESKEITNLNVPILSLGEGYTIQYDMAVDTLKENVENVGVKERFKVTPYYINKVEQIYFKPNATLLNQHLLDYQKAWVEFEMANMEKRWMASPLQNVYAGDIYAPTGDTYKGRQETPAFTPIEYKENTGTGVSYSRWAPAFYQKAWNHDVQYSEVKGTPTDDQIATVKAVKNNWSIEYNDVTVEYPIGKGFYLSVEDVPGEGTALVRLPKADKSYTYENAPTPQTKALTETSDRSNAGRLAELDTDSKAYIIDLSKAYNNGDYYLIGNPAMAYLKMDGENGFLQKNGISTYWTYQKGTFSATVDNMTEDKFSEEDGSMAGYIAPMQAFFIEWSKAEDAEKTVTFTPDMFVSKPEDPGTESVAYNAFNPTLTLTAERGDQRSVAKLAMREDAHDGYEESEDAIALIDSELDVPVVYTVAGTAAAQVNALQAIRNVGLGVYNEAGGEVTVAIEGMSQLTEPLYLYDAKTRKSVELVGDRYELTVDGESHGRYFLQSGLSTANDRIQTGDDISIYSLRPGEIVVTTVGTPLRSVRVYGIGGELVAQQSLANQSVYRLRVPGNAIYVVYAEDMDGIIRNVKLRVR